jgi:hypothetical protein
MINDACCLLDLLYNSEDGGVRSSETLLNFYWTKRCKIPQDLTFHHNLFSNIILSRQYLLRYTKTNIKIDWYFVLKIYNEHQQVK